jgi:hypothetical protein
MNKEIKDRLDKLENELKESKNEIHSLKSSVSLRIERGIGKLLSRFTRKQLILGFVIALFSISIIGIAGTVTKTYTFSSGDVVSASKINSNFDTLFTLVNGNLDGSNISGISVSKITGTLDNSSLPKPADSIVFFSTHQVFKGDFGGRSEADQICRNNLDNNSVFMFHNSCSNVRALISVNADDEIRDMVANYGVPTDRELRGINDVRFGTSWDNVTSESFLIPMSKATPLQLGGNRAWSGTIAGGALGSKHCTNWTDASDSNEKSHLLDPTKHIISSDSNRFFLTADSTTDACTDLRPLICICY